MNRIASLKSLMQIGGGGSGASSSRKRHDGGLRVVAYHRSIKNDKIDYYKFCRRLVHKQPNHRIVLSYIDNEIIPTRRYMRVKFNFCKLYTAITASFFFFFL